MSDERETMTILPRSEEWVSDAQAGLNVQTNTTRIEALLQRITYREGWSFDVIAHGGWARALRIRVNTTDPHLSRDGRTVGVLIDHQFQVPWFVMGEAETLRWLLDNVLAVERHEACEWLQVDGIAPFMPEHGEGSDPYRIPTRNGSSPTPEADR
jgi:hypothetical protein